MGSLVRPSRVRQLIASRAAIEVGVAFAIALGVGSALLFCLRRPVGVLAAFGALAIVTTVGVRARPRWIDEPSPPDEPLEMTELPGGVFWMGSRDDDGMATPDERPRHQVQVAPFAIATTLVTRRQYRRVIGRAPSAWQPGHDDLPATHVSWHEAAEFCRQLTEQVGLSADDGYRLPTEAEWEYACRAGTDTRWSCGNDDADLPRFAWYSENAGSRLHPVKTREPNGFGLYDMHGNAREWCPVFSN